MPRSLKTRRHKKRFFHLFFNGEVAEPQYFEGFNRIRPSNFHVAIHRKAKDKSEAPWQLIDRAIEKKSSLKNFNPEDGDEIWCVFDVDDYFKENPNKFRAAIKKAEEAGIKLCWSNQAFEIWPLLHFEYCESAVCRKDYDRKLQKYFEEKCGGFEYEKNCDVFDALRDLQEEAIKRAERLFKMHPNLHDNPSTRIFELVQALKSLTIN